MAGHNTYGSAGDFFNEKAAEYADAANQSLALGLRNEAEDLEKKAAHCCELFAGYRARVNAAKATKE